MALACPNSIPVHSQIFTTNKLNPISIFYTPRVWVKQLCRHENTVAAATLMNFKKVQHAKHGILFKIKNALFFGFICRVYIKNRNKI
ncbi:hypothetical protein ES319_D10G045500v1 [Gossypium barbadense]|uniref:Uncharacterized protein n=3 Tax=Gossypium TaxID=3633 RepID=A0A0D2RGU1_GOSRA|nr:hypothetical protein ES319_D10G045500v1 [Gossypium barbadense]KJB69842.1 hypothetical protein B456_011G045400 [Gossypium raimondii]